ncbi:Protein tssc1, variant 2 [Dermatophagoides farinae]|uniref:Protein tssc1, variant 2 n=1 Tax=Dermatophagoides farinae TaxID=6954 RepID=A0A922HQA0_DERFA|nr:Protein tssc1, variant 2 [Dermatophagoides farinae]
MVIILFEYRKSYYSSEKMVPTFQRNSKMTIITKSSINFILILTLFHGIVQSIIFSYKASVFTYRTLIFWLEMLLFVSILITEFNLLALLRHRHLSIPLLYALNLMLNIVYSLLWQQYLLMFECIMLISVSILKVLLFSVLSFL